MPGWLTTYGYFWGLVFQGDERIRSSSECAMADNYIGMGSPVKSCGCVGMFLVRLKYTRLLTIT